MKLIEKQTKDMANGMRDMSRRPLSADEIDFVKSEIRRIEAMNLYLCLMMKTIRTEVHAIILLTIKYTLHEMYSLIQNMVLLIHEI